MPWFKFSKFLVKSFFLVFFFNFANLMNSRAWLVNISIISIMREKKCRPECHLRKLSTLFSKHQHLCSLSEIIIHTETPDKTSCVVWHNPDNTYYSTEFTHLLLVLLIKIVFKKGKTTDNLCTHQRKKSQMCFTQMSQIALSAYVHLATRLHHKVSH
jgi:hypothetical protein